MDRDCQDKEMGERCQVPGKERPLFVLLTDTRTLSPAFYPVHPCLNPLPLELLEEEFIYVAPAPFFARLKGFDNRVAGCVKVFGRVLILGRIAAAHVAARFAQSQVHPTVTHLQTLLAALRRARSSVSNLVQMRTLRAHIFSPSFYSLTAMMAGECMPMSAVSTRENPAAVSQSVYSERV
jgi:hypothetical protein